MERAIVAIGFLAILGVCVAPRSGALWLAFLTAVPLLAARSAGRLDGLREVSPLAIVTAILVAYLLANATWSIDRAQAFGKVGSLALVLLAAHAATAASRAMTGDQLGVVIRAIAIAAACGALFLCIEVLSGQRIMRFVLDLLPVLRMAPKHAPVAADGTLAAINPYVLNRHVGGFSLILWPAVAMIGLVLPRRLFAIAAAVVVAIAALAVFRSEHETSMLAIIAALVTLSVALRWPVTAGRMLLVGWIAATMLVVPLALSAYAAKLHLAKSIPETGRNRIILWAYTAGEWGKAPIRGVGVASTKELDDQRAATATLPDGHTYPLRTGRHSHNIYMQTWYELGAVGAVILLAFGWALLGVIARLTPQVRPYAYATFASAAVMAAFSWGMWQVWFLSLFAASFVLIAFAEALARDQTRGAGRGTP